jgi:hypothetical protein
MNSKPVTSFRVVPHAVKNESGHPAVLLEYADQTQQDSTYEKIELMPAS